jgi:N-acetylneuraminate lyase
MAPVYHKVIEAFRAGDMAEARRWQMLSIQIISVMVRHGGLPANKVIMSLIGLDCGPVRPPLRNLTADEMASLRRDLERVGFPAQVPPLASGGKTTAWTAGS